MKQEKQIVWRSMFDDLTPVAEEKKEKVKRNLNYFIEEKRSKKELLEFFKRKAKALDLDPDDIAEKSEPETEEDE